MFGRVSCTSNVDISIETLNKEIYAELMFTWELSFLSAPLPASRNFPERKTLGRG